MDTQNYDVIVLGGGISGLTAAYAQQKKGANFLLLEGSDKMGGVINTVEKDGFRMEHGPNSILGNQDILNLIKDLGIEDKLRKNEAVASTRYMLFRDKLLKLKPGWKFFASGFLNFRMIGAVLSEPFQGTCKEEDETIASFIKRRLNKDFLNRMINPLVTGIYAGDPERLSLRSTFKKFYAMEQEYGSLIKATFKRKEKTPKREALSFSEGLKTLVDSLQDQLGEKAQLNAQINSVIPLDEGFEVSYKTPTGEQTIFTKKLISTLPTLATTKVFNFLEPDVKATIEEVEHAPMLLVYLGYPTGSVKHPQDGFGYLIAQQENQPYLGGIWSSAIFPDVSPKGTSLFTLFVGGVNNKHVIDNVETSIEKAKTAFEKHMEISAKPTFQSHYLYQRAIPQFNLGHYKLMETMDGIEKKYPGLYFSGNWRSGVAIGDCVSYNLNL